MILDDIIKKTKLDLIDKKKNISYNDIEKKVEQKIEQKSFIIKDVIKALRSENNDEYKIIAEVKKASPSKGLIRENFQATNIAKDYEKAKANAISVLTEEHFFMGHLDYMFDISKNVNIPILRKDFIVDNYQILEAKLYGADFILLIAKCLNEQDLKNLYTFARSLDLEVLVEVHDEVDLEKALKIDANIIGINHRNLEDFSMNMKLCYELIPQIGKDKIKIAESGIDNKNIMKELSDIGVDAFLIGEFFMRQDNIIEAVKKLKS